MSDNIKVVVKVRPLIPREIEDKLSYQWRVKNNTLYQLDQNGKDLGQNFTFDGVYDKDTKTSDVYEDIAKPIVQAATAGFNGTIFAYGQTSSGKTYTMSGTDSSPGIIPLAIINLFEIIKNVPDRDFLVRVSYIEIYNETVKDLLKLDKENIKIHETSQGIKVDAFEKVTSSPEEVLQAMREGEANRQKGSTNMNEQSSRSHSIFQIIIESREHIEGEEEPGCVNVSQLNLVDLAGSERSGQTGATGLRFKEGTHINKSLSALALVIKQLSEDPNKFANYRDSKLTRILQNSLGGNAKTSIICAITPAAVEETISTLQFANRAKAIKNKPEVNAVATADSTMIQRLTKQMCKLQAQLESKKNIEQVNYELQSKIQNLQKVILNGFAQRRSVDLLSGTRRKLQAPRRITISTLHSIPDDEPVVSIPKFCTPSLKYNPSSFVTPDFAVKLPASNTSNKLAAVPEEPARLVTPPPVRTVFFSDEVIELDSDDDDSTRDAAQTCSPVHKCYGETKTPPCILRRNAKEAERNLKGIIELTEREKMYSPNVVEYIEKLDNNMTVIAELQDQIELMNRQSKEKDSEVDQLKIKIQQTEEAIKSLTSSKTELQSQCKMYNTKLTDAEVSYETLRNKAKLREEELLSLLEELTAKNKKPEVIDKVMSRTLDKEIHFMDISKDVDIVISDIESIVNTNDDESDPLNEILADTQSELNLKNQALIELEADIFAQQQKISSLEGLNKNLQEEVTTFKERLSLMDSENSLLKSNIDMLNSTIKDQKENLDIAKNDIDSYKSLVQELQIKIIQKEKLPSINIDDSAIENMIANEEKIIAGNENMKNIFLSLKIALETRSKEIDKLRTSGQLKSDENVTLTERLESKIKEVDSLNKTINENITNINKLMHEKDALKTVEKELSEKLANFENKSLEASLKQATIYNENIQSSNIEKTDLLDRNKVLENLTTMLEEKVRILQEKISELTEIIFIKEQITNSIQERDELLNNVFKKITEFTINYNIQNDIRGEVGSECTKIHESILLTLDKIGNHITSISSKNDDNGENVKVNEMLLEAKQEILELTQHNLSLIEQISQVESKYSELSFKLTKIQDDNEQLNKELSMSQRILESLQEELKMKADELSSMEDKVKDWKKQFKSIDCAKKQQMDELKLENEQLKASIAGVRHKPKSNSIITYEHKDSYDIVNQDLADLKPIPSSSTCGDISSPPSLLTICCNKIVDAIQLKEIESNTTTTSSNEYSDNIEENYIVECKCNELNSELEAIRKENFEITKLLEQLKAVNQYLIQEQEEARNEIQLLVAPAHELQKKIINHKTNLSILTATTTAENRVLKSKIKGLHHHHSRFHNVCQRDIPDFKKHLRELMTLLRGDPSIADQQNANFKRYSLPDVLDSSNALPTFQNESTLDGDLLMLDTNITITTAVDNTSTAHDQTCLDLTQFYNEASCQTNDLNQIEIPSHDMNVYERLNMLKDENVKLRESVNKFAEMKQSMTDAQISPIEINNLINECDKCKKQAELLHAQEELHDELKSLYQELSGVKIQKAEIEQKYNNMMLEIPSTDILIKKLNNLEKDYNIKIQEITTVKSTLSINVEELNRLQDENDSLSTQIMDNISETDDLNKELLSLKKINTELLEKCCKLEQSVMKSQLSDSCSECLSKDELIKTMELRLTKTHTKLNRSLSDSDTSSRYNKICTLQSELDAGRKDCKEITEDVVTIKNHLDRSNLSMDLDDSMGESNMYEFTKDFAINSPQSNKCSMPDIPEEHPIDMYKMDKIDCYNYCAEKTGVDNDNINRDMKIIDIMKTFYEYLITKHGNEVENLTNKIKYYDETKSQLENQISNLKEKHSQVTIELEQKDQNYSTVVNALSQIKNNINTLNQEIFSFTDADVPKLVNMYKDYFFKVLDNELGLSSMKMIETLFNNIVNKHETDLSGITEQYTKLQGNMETVTKELSSLSDNLEHMKCQLSAKEEEYSLLKKQKERIQEISNAVTLDIVKKDKELTETISNVYKKLVELNVVKNQDIDLNLPANTNIALLFEHVITQHKNSIRPDTEKEKENLALEVKHTKQIIETKQKEIHELQAHIQNLQEINNAVTADLMDKENKLLAQTELYTDLDEIYESKVEENKANIDLIEKLTEEVKLLKGTVEEKEKTIEKLELEIDTQNKCKVKEFTELIETVKAMKDDIAHLKAMNEVIVKEKDSYADELLKSGNTIKQNNIEMDKMTSDILVLRESGRENGIVIEKLNAEAKSLLKQNMELKEKFEDKCAECSRLATNIKTHEKSAEVQTRMIMRLKTQKIDDDKTITEMTQQIKELKHKVLQHNDAGEIELLKKSKETLEARVAELEQLVGKSRPSIDALADLSRRRRQSLHDSKRLFGEDKHEYGDHNSAEAIFESRQKPDDLFMDVDENISNRSSPIMRHSKGRDSLSLSKTDQDEEALSRPSSVVATRRRRQSIHDQHRSVLSHTPSPGLDQSKYPVLDEFNHSKPSETSGDVMSEVSHLRERLAFCQQELEDLKEKYRELDDECETCAEYLRERDEQCVRLRQEKVTLQATVSDLKEKLESCSSNDSKQISTQLNVADVGVNTDEDWTNLHSVVVDRMSFDAEVEKNKKLTKTSEELRFKNQDLKNTLAKMQKALEKNSSHRELISAREELQSCKKELLELRESYKELDEECETCAQYLREKEEHCRRLKEAKTALEAQLQEIQGEHHAKPQSMRKKRQSLHDQNRPPTCDFKDACTETCDELLSYQVERDGSDRLMAEDKQAKEIKYLKLAVEELSQQKTFLEQKLASESAAHAPRPMYVATGSAIVQNQQLTDVMRENQKLKRINAKLVTICKKRDKDSNRENEDPVDRT